MEKLIEHYGLLIQENDRMIYDLSINEKSELFVQILIHDNIIYKEFVNKLENLGD